MAEPKADEKNRIIFVTGTFNEVMAQNVISKTIELECQDPVSDIIYYIDSYGGQVDSFIAIHDAMRLCRCDIATICVGKAMSCGQLLLMSGAKGKRLITPNSRVLVHEVSSIHAGKLAELDNNLDELKRLQLSINDMILKYTKIKKAELTTLLFKDSYLTANQALKYGIVDGVVSSPRMLYSKIRTARN